MMRLEAAFARKGGGSKVAATAAERLRGARRPARRLA